MIRTKLLHLMAVTAVFLAGLHGQEPYTALKQAGARNLLIVLNCNPGDRPAFRRAISTDTVLKLAELKKKGSVQSYRALFNRFLDSDTWDVLILAEFANNAGPEKSGRKLKLQPPRPRWGSHEADYRWRNLLRRFGEPRTGSYQ